MLVNVPSFSVCEAAGRKKISVAICPGDVSPASISGESYQNDAVSISARSRTTSHSRELSASRCSRALAEPTTGFWPTAKRPLHCPSIMRTIVG